MIVVYLNRQRKIRFVTAPLPFGYSGGNDYLANNTEYLSRYDSITEWMFAFPEDFFIIEIILPHNVNKSVVNFTADNLNSFERYVLNSFVLTTEQMHLIEDNHFHKSVERVNFYKLLT